MSLLRDLAYAAVAVLSSPVWLWRLLRTGKWRTDWPARFGRCDRSAGPSAGEHERPTLLIHAVSLGEVNAIRLLVEELERRNERLRLVVATTTDSGYARAIELFGDQHAVVRYPLDFSFAVRRFLDAVRPTAVALVELEVWPNFVAECRRRHVPVVVINGRLSLRSYGRYRLIAPLVRGSFAGLGTAAVQDPAYAERFVGLGVPKERVEVTGTMKWDTAVIADEAPGAAELGRALGIDPQRPLIACGSTGPGEEVLMVEQLTTIRPGQPGRDALPPQILLAPRKPERFEAVAAELTARFAGSLGPVIRRSRRSSPGGTAAPAVNGRDGRPAESPAPSLFLLDTLGELRQAYALADVAVVGRSFCPMHGSDMMEPIGLGKPTVVGPHADDFRDMMEDLLAGGGIVQVSHATELPTAVERLLGTERGRTLAERGRAVIRSRQGATRRHAHLLEAWLKQPNGARQAAGSKPPATINR